MTNRSMFPAQIDSWSEKFELSPSQCTQADRWYELKMKSNKSSLEIDEFNSLTTTLASYIFGSEDFNKLTDCITSLETFFTTNVQGYITTKQSEFDNIITIKSDEINGLITTKTNDLNGLIAIKSDGFNTLLQKFSNKGNWSNLITYSQWNTVQYDYETFLSKVDNNYNHTPTGEFTDIYWQKMALRGLQGQAGVGLAFMGNYNNSNSYLAGHAVYYENSIYYCINSSTGNLPTNSAYWTIFLVNSGIPVQDFTPATPFLGQVFIDVSV